VARVLGDCGGISCAILEMPEALRDDIGDPYPFARRALARNRCLAQVLLVDEPDEKSSPDVERSSNKFFSLFRPIESSIETVSRAAFS